MHILYWVRVLGVEDLPGVGLAAQQHQSLPLQHADQLHQLLLILETTHTQHIKFIETAMLGNRIRIR
jgi:hypothetical protein